MHVGALRARLLLRESRTLKDKRQVVRAMIDRLRNGFPVAVAEVEARDDHKSIVLGVAAVAEESHLVRSTLEAVANALRGHPVAEFVSAEIESDVPLF